MLTTEKQNIVLAMHKNPDGDCCGAAWAMKLVLEKKYPNKKVFIYSDDPKIKFWNPDRSLEVEFTSYEKLPEDNELYILDHFDQDYSLVPNWEDKKFTHWKVIDHHWLQKTEKKNWDLYIDISAGSTCEIIFNYLKEHEEGLITPEVATALVLGIKSDSCHMTVDSRPEVIYMLNDLMKIYKCEDIVRQQQVNGYNNSFGATKGLIIPHLKMSMNTEYTITLQLDYKNYTRVTQRNKVSVGRILNNLQSIKNAYYIIFLYEFIPGSWNIAFRSRRKGVINLLKKMLNRQFLDYGFTIVGIKGEEQAKNYASTIKRTIKTFNKDYPIKPY